MSSFYVYVLNEHTLITHDGHIQLGIYHMTLEEFMSKVLVEYTETYWMPDTFSNRYKRANYQKLLTKVSTGTKDN